MLRGLAPEKFTLVEIKKIRGLKNGIFGTPLKNKLEKLKQKK
jgi:hypothetical protein